MPVREGPREALLGPADHSSGHLRTHTNHPLSSTEDGTHPGAAPGPAPEPAPARLGSRSQGAPASAYTTLSEGPPVMMDEAAAAPSGGAAGPPTGPVGVAAVGTSAAPCGAAAAGAGLGSTSSGQLHLTVQRSENTANGGGFSPECRICLLAEPLSDLVCACHCIGSLRYAHLHCLRSWVVEKRSIHCELCGTMYKEPYGSELAAAIPPALPAPTPRRLTAPDGQPILIMPMGMSLGPGGQGHLLLQHPGGGATMLAADPRDLEPQPLCEWRNMWSYGLILLLLLFAIIYVTVISKRGKQEPWMMTLWQVLLVVLPIYLVLRVAFDLYRHRLAQQLAAANLQAMAMANAAADAAVTAAHPAQAGGPREIIITRSGNRVLVLQRAGP